MLSKEDIKNSLPTQLNITITDEFVNLFNDISDNPILAEEVRNNFVSYSSIVKEGKFKVIDYFNAVKYVSHKIIGYTNKDSYKLTFPDRWKLLEDANVSAKDISSYVAAYNKNKLVNMVFEQTLIPVHILNADVYQKAINTQAELMLTARSEKVRSDAANSLLTHLKRPETKKIELDISAKDNSGIKELKDTLYKLSQQQIQQINNGTRTKDIASQQLVDITPKEKINEEN